MPHISRQFLKADMEKRLIRAMVDTLSLKGGPKQRADIHWELFTGVERLMLAKRLAIIVMLARGVSVDAIAEKLMVSPSTVSRLRVGVESGKFATTIKAARRNKVEELVAAVLKTLVLGPRQRTEPRWKWLEDF